MVFLLSRSSAGWPFVSSTLLFRRGVSQLVYYFIGAEWLISVFTSKGSWLLYILTFCQVTKRNIKRILDLFRCYGDLSYIYFGKSVSSSRMKQKIVAWGFDYEYFLLCIWVSLCSKVHLRLRCWNLLLISFCIILRLRMVNYSLMLIDDVITFSFVHSFMVYRWSVGLIKSLNTAIRNFLWIGNISQKKVVFVP